LLFRAFCITIEFSAGCTGCAFFIRTKKFLKNARKNVTCGNFVRVMDRRVRQVTFFKDSATDLDALYRTWSDLLFRVALSHLQNREDAQDAVQDVFLKYLRVAPRFRDDEHAKAWLLRVTVNTCRDQLRRRTVRTYLPLEEIAELVADESSASEEAVQGVARILRQLSELPEKNRTVLILHALEGLSVEEVAATLGLSQSAVKMRLSRGREQLRNLMKEDGGTWEC
jgi:RNA polymerase sigma-70 factor (ECF subfamily)